MHEKGSTVLAKQGLRAEAMRLPVLLAAALAAALMFHGSRGLYETTEGRYAECAREMARSGSWLEPKLNNAPHWTKPPLTYWAIRIPCSLVGPTTWAARLYLIPCYLGTIAAVWWLALRLWGDRRTARLCATVYATSVLPMIASQVVSSDYLLTLVLAAGQACFWEAFRKRSTVAIYGLWLCLGIAFSIKGPPALLVLPALCAVWARLPKLERVHLRLFAPGAIAVFLLVGFGWYLWEAGLHPGLLDHWVKDEVVGRSLSDKFNRHPQFYQNFLIYLPILLFGMFPWTGVLAARGKAVGVTIRTAFKSGLQMPVEPFWLLVAFAVPLGVFMLSRSKLPLYMLPLFVPLSLGTGRVVAAVYGDWLHFRRGVIGLTATTLLLFAVGKGVASRRLSGRDMAQLYTALTVREGVRDPTRLGVLGSKHLNGLSYYYDHVLTMVDPKDLSAWLHKDRTRVVLCNGSKLAKIKQLSDERLLEDRPLHGKWRLIHLPKPGVALPPVL